MTHVLRGQEHLNNTPRHVCLQRALGYRLPVYAHLPIIFNPDGSKMSKRDKDKTLKRAVKELRDNSPIQAYVPNKDIPVPEVPPPRRRRQLGG